MLRQKFCRRNSFRQKCHSTKDIGFLRDAHHLYLIPHFPQEIRRLPREMPRPLQNSGQVPLLPFYHINLAQFLRKRTGRRSQVKHFTGNCYRSIENWQISCFLITLVSMFPSDSHHEEPRQDKFVLILLSSCI